MNTIFKTTVKLFFFLLAAFLITTAAKSSTTTPDGFLEGTFIVRCPGGHTDTVEGITRNHDCEKCGLKAVDGGTAYVVCPDGHATRVEGITRTHLCTQVIDCDGHLCGKQCRR
jgi:hypothetical protein